MRLFKNSIKMIANSKTRSFRKFGFLHLETLINPLLMGFSSFFHSTLIFAFWY